MVTREELHERRDEVLARRDELMDRAAELRERFADEVDDDAVTMAVGLSLLSAGIAWGLTGVLRGRRGMLSLLLPLSCVGAGLFIAGRGMLGKRGAHIRTAEDRVREELASLDPLAKAQVLRDMAGEQFAFVRHSHN